MVSVPALQPDVILAFSTPATACLYRKLDSAIVVMKSAEDRPRCDAAYVLDGAMDRSVFAKRPMSPQLVIISGILRQDLA